MDIDDVRSHLPRRARRRPVLFWLAVSSVLLGVGCSSDSGDDAAAGGSGNRPPTEQDAGEDSGQGDGGAGASSDVNESPVCEVIAPVVDDMVAAAALDLPLTDDSPADKTAAGCELRFAGPEATVTVTIGRVPAVISTVDAMVSSFQDVDPVGPLPSLGDDAQLLEDSMDGSTAYVLLSGNGRVWQVTAYDSTAGTADAADSGEVGTAIAEVLKARIDA
ncbi:MAG: hypothetical protein GX643_09590 [Acidimicrobiales bacterium]|nr:hypothetical protein [Acidimicrobiales bacterium]